MAEQSKAKYMAKTRERMKAAGLERVHAIIPAEAKALVGQIASAKNKEQQILLGEMVVEAVRAYVKNHGLPVESQMDLPIAS